VVFVAIVAGALANWFMLSMIFSIWFDITKDKSTNPTLYAALWAGGLMVVLIGLALTPAGEAFFRFCNGCRRLIHTEEDRLRPLFDDVCARAKLNPDKYELFTQDDKFPNAFAMGRKTVCVTRGLFLVYSDEDIRGILAHEMGHHVYGDAVRGIVFFMITLVGQVIMWGSWLVGKILSLLPFLAGSEGSREREHAGIFTAFANVVWVIMWLFQIFVWIPIQIGACFGSRQQEYRADAYAAKIGYREEILEFLTNILDIEGRPKGFMGLLYRTHPKIGDRIRRLEDMDVNALPDAPGQRPGVWARITSIVKERFERTADALRRERPLKD
jgi:heat shock protein HtpX